IPAWCTACQEHKLNVRLIPRNVATRWNSTYDMLVVARQYSAVIDGITADKKLQLCKYELSEQQWKIVDDLIHIFKQATLLFLKDSASTISQVIPMMDVVDNFLRDAPKRPLHDAVKAALKLAQSTLDRYYSRTDASNVYRIAMGMLLAFTFLFLI
ncbi:hypothetical protein BDP27DRAFT_1237031, partial [Rhodocollybia butyracea]